MIKFEKYSVVKVSVQNGEEIWEEEDCFDSLEEAVAVCETSTNEVRYMIQMVYEQYRDDESPLGDSDVVKEWEINENGEAEEI